MKKISLILTSIILSAGIIYTVADSKEQPKNLAKKDSEELLATMADPHGGRG